MTTDVQALNRIAEHLEFGPNDERLVAALERIATALEQNVLERIPEDPYPKALEPVAEFGDLPPVRPAIVNGGCPIHHTPWRTVPAGTSKKTGRAYDAFQACSTAGCDQRPPR